jgi:hypothetical protein
MEHMQPVVVLVVVEPHIKEHLHQAVLVSLLSNGHNVVKKQHA